MTAIEKVKEVTAFLNNAGIEDAAKEAELIITEILNISKAELYTGSFYISVKESEMIDSFALRRSQGEPLQYIVGHVDFYGLKINVGKGVLIPRPETELLVEETIKAVSSVESQVSGEEKDSQCVNHHSPLRILDLCTGSGCIAIALAKRFPHVIVYGIDKSRDAIVYAERNAIENKAKDVHFVQGDLFRIAGDCPRITDADRRRRFGTVPLHSFDCIVSNPPYIKRGEIGNLQREIRDYEPIEALDGGEDGMDFYRRILKEAPQFLKKGGLLIMEAGFDQSDDIRELAENSGFKEVEFIKDYAGIERIFSGRII